MKANRTLLAILIGLALVWLAIMVFNSGYDVGSDLAERDNAAEAH